MLSVPIFLALLAMIIFAGFAGAILFERTKVPDVLILIGIGVLLGPVTHLIPNDVLRVIAPYFGALALVMIIFEGGIELEFRKVISQLGWAILLVVLSFGLSMAGVAAYLSFTGTLTAPHALLLGAIVGCTSGPIIIPLLMRMTASDRIKTILSVESSLSDAIAILVVLLLTRAFTAGMETGGEAVRMFIPSLITGAVVAVFAGVGWLYFLEHMRMRALSYVLTFAILLLVYSLVEFMHGSGAVAVLIFGVLIGNDDTVCNFLGIRRRKPSDPDQVVRHMLRWFHGEFSFIIRTFFFVFLGMLMDFTSFDSLVLKQGAIVFLILLLARWAAVKLTPLRGANAATVQSERMTLLFMIPRGLASAVLATHPAVVALTGTQLTLNTTFVVIVLTNILMVFGVAGLERRSARSGPRAKR